jgi:hypothetical protein
LFGRRHISSTEVAILGVCASKYCGSFFGEIYLPFSRQNAENTQGSTSTEPVFSNLLKVLDSMDDVSLGCLFRQVEQMNGTCGMDDIYSDITDLAETIGAFVKTHQLGD